MNKKNYIYLLVFIAVYTLTTPSNVAYHLEQARTYQERGAYERALEHLAAAHALQPKNAFIMTTYAYVASIAEHYEQALHLYKTLAINNPHNVDLLCNIGFILKKLSRYADAIAIYEYARTISPCHAALERGISHAYLILGKFEEGWKSYEYRWVPQPTYNQHLKDYLEQGGSMIDKTVLLKTEYGLGDTFQFIRYAQVLNTMGARIIVACHKQTLVPLLSLCPFINTVIAPEQPSPPSDFQALIMSLPYILHTTETTIPSHVPYLYADHQLITFWNHRLAQDHTFKIGVCWQADTHKTADNDTVKKDAYTKSIPLALLAHITAVPNVTLYSLQKINGLEQLNTLTSANRIITFDTDFDESHGSFMDTAALIKNLDLVITIDTSIAHLAGALGVPVWVALPYVADWRWMLKHSDSPWYPTMRLFRQPKAGDWASVIENIQQELHTLIFKKPFAMPVTLD